MREHCEAFWRPDTQTKMRLIGREGERLSEWSARAESVFHGCQRDAGMASPDMVNGACVYIAADCPMISGQWCCDAQARAEICLFLRIRFRRPVRRCHGVFVSDMPQEIEEDGENDKADSSVLWYVESRNSSLPEMLRRCREQVCSLLEMARKR